MPLYGGIEAGGTKFVCATGTGPDDLRDEIRFPTTTPAETIGRVVDYFKAQAKNHPLAGIGVASFGPIDPNPRSETWGYITATPKPGWTDTPFAPILERELNLPVGFDTDVNGAALGEFQWGAAIGLDNFVYLTVGTGIGGGAMVNGALLHGLLHPEMGHILLPPHPTDPHPEGFCPFHGHCLEGMANGPAIEKRWGQKAETLPLDHPAWQLEAHYLAAGLVNIIVTLSPRRIILGGGVMQQAHLFPLVRERLQALLNGYVQSSVILRQTDSFIVPPELGSMAGVLGAIALAEQAASSTKK